MTARVLNQSWVWCWLGLAIACGGDTEGQNIVLRWDVAKAPEAAMSFATDTGWYVNLDEAHIALESVFAIAPANDDAKALAWLSDLLVPVARAHGGHDDASGLRVRAELLDPFAIDALSDETVRVDDVVGEAGAVGTVKFVFARPDRDLPEVLHGFQAYVRGTAERDSETIRFAGGVHLADAEPARRVEKKVELTLREGGTLTIALHPDAWLREAEFDRLPETESAGAEREITADSQVGRAWAIGVRSPTAFDVTWKARKDRAP